MAPSSPSLRSSHPTSPSPSRRTGARSPLVLPSSTTVFPPSYIHASPAPTDSSASSSASPSSPDSRTSGMAGSVAPFKSLDGGGAGGSGAGASSTGMQRGHSSGLDPKLSPTLSSKPLLGGGGPASSGMMQRSNSSGVPARVTQMQQRAGGGAAPAGHLRRRSSSSNLQTALLLGDEASSTGMERAPSLTTFMSSGGKPKRDVLEREKRADSKQLGGAGKPHMAGPRVHRRRLYTSLTRLLGLITLTLLALYLVKKTFVALLGPPQLVADDSTSTSAPWLSGSSKGGALLFDTLETVPYPLKTHPRTPPKSARDSLPLAEYLTTRLGSHFSFPSANVPGRTTRGSQLWLTSATNRSVATSARHLVAFIDNLKTSTNPLAQFQSDYFRAPGDSVAAAGNETDAAGAVRPEERENADQRSAKRIVVTLCRDEGCMDYCRRDPELYCFGGFVRRDGAADEVGGTNADEVAKLRAVVDTLESGRRIFYIDEGVYFKDDPVPHMGDLSSYDVQIPDTWSSGYINAGLSFVNPTQRTISLFRKLLDIALLPSEEDRLGWASTNLLLDPSGQQRDWHRSAPKHSTAELDENLYEDVDAPVPAEGKTEYGQVEFESPWDGGLDVRVLSPKSFSTNEGRLRRGAFDFEKKKAGEALYFHCVCCGDTYTNDYIAGALGYHQPTVAYSLPQLTSVPTLPLVLKVPSLRGTPDQLRYAMGLLLQIAHDSSRVFVPPLAVTVLEDNAGRTRSTERYVFRVFPVARWAHPTAPTTTGVAQGTLPRAIKVREPGFVQHAAEHLRATFPDRPEAAKLVTELTETLFLDVRELTSLKDMVHGLTRPFWSTERIVSLEGVEDVMSKEGWELRSEFEQPPMCKRGEEREEKGTCTQMCPL
ncbi:hypothetical protein JCM10207_006850 [Rhodosporidiobolus poonsookiae]